MTQSGEVIGCITSRCQALPTYEFHEGQINRMSIWIPHLSASEPAMNSSGDEMSIPVRLHREFNSAAGVLGSARQWDILSRFRLVNAHLHAVISVWYGDHSILRPNLLQQSSQFNPGYIPKAVSHYRSCTLNSCWLANLQPRRITFWRRCAPRCCTDSRCTRLRSR